MNETTTGIKKLRQPCETFVRMRKLAQKSVTCPKCHATHKFRDVLVGWSKDEEFGCTCKSCKHPFIITHEEEKRLLGDEHE